MTEPAAYQVVARRYRPQRFDELIGQEHVARGLSGAIQSGRIGHAYLFCGARGTGKTSAARIFAKALECAAGPAAEPCNACEPCRAIAAGQDVDVVEIDAASNRGVDEIRQLRQNVAVRPAHGRFKIYIIDEVHMLTREAFNALLKTLEEPPSHVKFVLCTTEPDKLPITILSRCQRFDFTTVAPAAIARRLAQIVEAEGADVSAEALNLIARRAAGSMRDSQSLLEQLLGGATGPIGADEVHAMIGTGREERVGAMLAALADRDAPAALAALDAALAGGADPGGVLDQLVAALRDCLLASVGCGKDMLADEGSLGVDCSALGARLGTATILAMLQIIDQALARMAVSGHAAVLAEMAIVRLATLEDLDALAAAVERVGAAAGGPAATPPARPSAPPPREKKTADLTPAARSSAEPTAARATDAAGPATHDTASTPSAPPDAAVDRAAPELPEDALAVWLEVTGQSAGLAADFASTATAAAWRDGAMEVTIPTEQAISFLNRPEIAGAVSAALAARAGRRVAVRLVQGVRSADPPPSVDAAARGPAPARSRASLTQAALIKEAGDHPLVAHARQVFDAVIRRVEPPRERPPQPAEATPAGAAEAVEPEYATPHAGDDADE